MSPSGTQQGGSVGSGGSIGGQGPQQGGAADGGERPPKEVEWGDQDLTNARNAADLATEHLRSSLEEGRTDILDQLGWTPEQARAFLARWDALKKLAGSDDPRKRREFERAVQSLGLRPGGVRSSREVAPDARGGQAEGRRSRPPSDYREQFKAFLQGTGGE